jgi:hypothetical protein
MAVAAALERGMKRLLLAAVLVGVSSPALAALHVLIVEGLGGEKVYTTQFSEQSAAVRKAMLPLTDNDHLHWLDSKAATRAAIEAAFKSMSVGAGADDRLALFLVGHGSFDGADFKFNIEGPDITGAELKSLLTKFPSPDQLIVATGSSSGALQELLKSQKRVVITGTRSGAERNVTRFGAEFANALGDATADTDKNASLSAQEAFDFAQRNVKGFYEREVRLASEHAQISGERAARFVMARVSGAGSTGAGTEAGTSSSSPLDAVTQAKRDEINNALDALRLRKADLAEEDYSTQLEALLLQLARLDAGGTGDNPP